jgi:hypothetical protein
LRGAQRRGRRRRRRRNTNTCKSRRGSRRPSCRLHSLKPPSLYHPTTRPSRRNCSPPRSHRGAAEAQTSHPKHFHGALRPPRPPPKQPSRSRRNQIVGPSLVGTMTTMTMTMAVVVMWAVACVIWEWIDFRRLSVGGGSWVSWVGRWEKRWCHRRRRVRVLGPGIATREILSMDLGRFLQPVRAGAATAAIWRRSRKGGGRAAVASRSRNGLGVSRRRATALSETVTKVTTRVWCRLS